MRTRAAEVVAADPAEAAEDVFELLSELTSLLLRWSYEGTFRAEEIVEHVAAHFEVAARVVVGADSAVLTCGGQAASFTATPAVPPLDQASDLRALVCDIDDGGLTAREATERLRALQRRPPRFSKAWQVVGLALFATGFGISVQGTGQEIVASAVLGLLVGLIAVGAQDRPRLALVAPFAASVLVSSIVLVAFKHDWIEGGPIQLMVPCLFFFIPGDAISAAMLELANGRITAGATRLVYSVAILLVLAFGALIATVIVNVPESSLFDVEVQDTLGFWVAWGGWIIFAVGTMLTFSMRPADFPWALGLILLTAGVAQLVTAAASDVVGNFVAAVVMTVTALLLARSRRRPPAFVLYIGAFYVLTPGSHGLRGFETWLGGHPIQGFKGVGDMVALFTALAVGMLVGAAAVGRGGPSAPE